MLSACPGKSCCIPRTQPGALGTNFFSPFAKCALCPHTINSPNVWRHQPIVQCAPLKDNTSAAILGGPYYMKANWSTHAGFITKWTRVRRIMKTWQCHRGIDLHTAVWPTYLHFGPIPTIGTVMPPGPLICPEPTHSSLLSAGSSSSIWLIGFLCIA